MKKKNEDGKPLREKKFIDLPEYPGGKDALHLFIRKHLKYPDEALSKQVEGIVHVQYWVDGQGKVSDAEVIHGIGSGCDEEALRVVRMLKYGKVKNRGLRVKASMRTRIEFKLPLEPGIQYSYSTGTKPDASSEKVPPPSITYTYKISLPPTPDK